VWLNDGNPWGLPGIEYPGGGAVRRTLHVWLAALEYIDMAAPDNYMQNSHSYKSTADFYSTGENALFTPESSPNATGASNMFYAIARGAVGNAIFGSESCLDNQGNVRESALPLRDSNYAVQQALPLILKHRNTGKMHSVIRHEGETDAAYEFEEFFGNVRFTSEGAFTDYSNLRETLTPEQKTPRGLIIEDENKVFYLLGRFSLRMVPKKSPDVSFAGGYIPSPDFVSVEEGHFDGRGIFVTDRVRNGDEAFAAGFWVTPNCGVVRVVLV
jgi:hypothetical protein